MSYARSVISTELERQCKGRTKNQIFSCSPSTGILNKCLNFLERRANGDAVGPRRGVAPSLRVTVEAMRSYRFLSAKYGIKSLTEKRLKISRLDELNDPFELLPFDLRNRSVRFAVKMTRTHLAQRLGILCFSATWRDPVLWAHYADRHRGLCLGFEIPDDPDVSREVKYVEAPLPFPEVPTLKETEAMLFTKYVSWQYEKEIRILAALNEEVDGIFYSDFSDSLKPVEVIAGARCEVSRDEIVSGWALTQRWWGRQSRQGRGLADLKWLLTNVASNADC